MANASLDYNSVGELPDRFWDKVNKTDTCWLWTGKVDDGYGRYSINAKYYLVHRLVVASLKEPVNLDMVVDHICKVRNCCNPDHLRQITKSENSKNRQSVDPGYCVNGHPLFDEGSQTHTSYRRTRHNGEEPSITCRICNSVKRLINAVVKED
jgi:hypothetical protein